MVLLMDKDEEQRKKNLNEFSIFPRRTHSVSVHFLTPTKSNSDSPADTHANSRRHSGKA